MPIFFFVLMSGNPWSESRLSQIGFDQLTGSATRARNNAESAQASEFFCSDNASATETASASDLVWFSLKAPSTRSTVTTIPTIAFSSIRSEERRVGKE